VLGRVGSSAGLAVALAALALPVVAREARVPADLGTLQSPAGPASATPVRDPPRVVDVAAPGAPPTSVGQDVPRDLATPPPGSMAAEPPASAGTVRLGGLTARHDAAALVPGDAVPVLVTLDRLALRADLHPTGLQPDGSVEIPADVDLAGWYEFGSRPGEAGPTVLVGHVDAASQGTGAFRALLEAVPGDRIQVKMSDGSLHEYAVTARRTYLKEAVPLDGIFGEGDGLRLITCSGDFDLATRSYESNVVIYASPAPSLPPGSATFG